MNITRLKLTTGRRQNSWLFTNVAEELNYQETAPAKWSERDLNRRPPDLKFGALTARLRYLLENIYPPKNISNFEIFPRYESLKWRLLKFFPS